MVLKKYTAFFGNKSVFHWAAVIAMFIMAAGVIYRTCIGNFELYDALYNVFLILVTMGTIISFFQGRKEVFKGLCFALTALYAEFWLNYTDIFYYTESSALYILNQFYFAILILGSLTFFIVHCMINTSNNKKDGLVEFNQILSTVMTIFIVLAIIVLEAIVISEAGIKAVNWTWVLNGLEGIAVLNVVCSAETFVNGFRTDRENGEALPIDQK